MISEGEWEGITGSHHRGILSLYIRDCVGRRVANGPLLLVWSGRWSQQLGDSR